ncbi:DUF922 domain-containing protein [Hymenobacter glacialis]|uniref:DUF922 domain-containing protein n=1 Tax=Hymenobacter glacialis TaxID=1908236 RepID=A0A1G1T4N2_9BACT|nr:DUF922 domain-containing protein [Hymenobacter glacialis]OGX85832.1 hypothetical protein BEN48_14095 [Hymenobacter glacialis]
MFSFLTSFVVVAALWLQGPVAKPGQPAAPAPGTGTQPAKPAAAPIPWSATRRLAIEDFQARPKSYEKLAALTTTDIKAGAACRDFVFTGTVQATFDPALSWFRDPKNFTPQLLRHEQLHFDITEVYARIMRQKLVVFQAKADCAKLQPAFNNLTKGVYAEWDREQNRFDAETNHGLNTVKQDYWEKQTQIKLAQLEAFAAPQ